MPDVQWIKITTDILNDNKIRIIDTLPEADAIFRIWIGILTLAGQSNEQGFVYLSENIPYTDEMLATVLNRPVNVVRLALNTLERFGMIGLSDNGVLYITNWEKHQNIDGIERIREQTRARVTKHRDKQKALPCNVTSNVTVTGCNGGEVDIEKDKEQIKDIPQKKPAESIRSTSKPKQSNPTKDAFYKAWNDCFLAENGFAYTWVAADWVQYAKYNVDAISPDEIVAMVKAWFTLPPETGSFNTRKVCVLVSNLSKAKALLKAATIQKVARAEDW